jgi:meso-butanediol dehydrogenase/(S,S)-butanediol dehydrogenase/diacetyl reductase
MRLQDKVCVVTGGGSGIGAATCALFAREGAKLVVADMNLDAAQAVADAAKAAGGQAVAFAVDVSNSEAVHKLIDFALAQFGRLDVLVNNAGFGFAGTVVDTDEADWDRLMAVNLKGVFLGCKHAIPVMQRQGGGAIVNTASVVSTVGVRDRAAYCASKGGVASLTRAMALDHVDAGIRVNAVAPGTIDSPYFDQMLAKTEDPVAFKKGIAERQAMGRLGKPEEIAGAILYLASDEASFVTGSLLTVDGGMTAQ